MVIKWNASYYLFQRNNLDKNVNSVLLHMVPGDKIKAERHLTKINSD